MPPSGLLIFPPPPPCDDDHATLSQYLVAKANDSYSKKFPSHKDESAQRESQLLSGSQARLRKRFGRSSIKTATKSDALGHNQKDRERSQKNSTTSTSPPSPPPLAARHPDHTFSRHNCSPLRHSAGEAIPLRILQSDRNPGSNTGRLSACPSLGMCTFSPHSVPGRFCCCCCIEQWMSATHSAKA